MNLTANLNASYASLNHAFKDMRLLWAQTQDQWKDSVSESFAREHWEPLETDVLAALRAMDRISPILLKMQQDCGGNVGSSEW
jgi:hypothetical protein